MKKTPLCKISVYVLILTLLAGCSSSGIPAPSAASEEGASASTISDIKETAVTSAAPPEATAPAESTVPITAQAEEEITNTHAQAENLDPDSVPQTKEGEKSADEGQNNSHELSEVQKSGKNSLTEKQRNSINMLNYLTVLVQEINSSPNSRLFLESAYSELINNTEPSIVDELTLDEYEKILSQIEEYRMIAVKRDRLQYLYDQNSAKALQNAMPNPLSIMNVVQSENPFKALVSVAYLAFDSANSYSAYTNELNMQYLQSGWALDDEQATNLHNTRSSMFAYMVRVSRDLPEGLTLSEDSVNDFVEWSNERNVTSRIRWLESNQDTYKNYGEYWLVLAKSYYEKAEAGESIYFTKCLDAIHSYEGLDNSIFRKDIRLAQILPYGISAARESLARNEYEKAALEFANGILDNTYHSDWNLRYFAAQTLLDLYSSTKNRVYLSDAYEIIYDNVNELVAKQRAQNSIFLDDVKKQSTEKIDKNTKKQVIAYNDLLSEARKTELCPVYEPLRLNCELLFGIADKLNISATQRADIDSILHHNGEPLFLNTILDNSYKFSNKAEISASEIQINFDKGTIEIPVVYISDSAKIDVIIDDGTSSVDINDWSLSKVERRKSHDVSDFTAIFESSSGKKADYPDNALITIRLSDIAVGNIKPNDLEFKYRAVKKTYVLVIPSVSFERIL